MAGGAIPLYPQILPRSLPYQGGMSFYKVCIFQSYLSKLLHRVIPP